MPKPLNGDSEDTGSQPDTDVSAAPQSQAEIPGSSAGENQDDVQGSTLELIEQTIGETEKEQDENSSGAENSDADEPDKEGEGDGAEEDKGSEAKKAELTEISEEELAQEKPKTAERIRALLDERRELAAKLDETERSQAVYREKADRFDHIDKIRVENGLELSEMDEGFNIMAMMKSDPLKALEMLRPHYEGLMAFAGEKLSPELEEKVANGLISREDAKDLAASRNRAGHEQMLREQAAKRIEEQDRSREQASNAKSVRAALNDWDVLQAKKDPQWNVKQKFVAQRINALAAAQPVKTQEQLLAICEKARDEVNEELSAFAPRQQRKIVDPLLTTPSLKTPPADADVSTLNIINRVTNR